LWGRSGIQNSEFGIWNLELMSKREFHEFRIPHSEFQI
jgi:hypothetical protein